jgi:DNA-binding NarL/FixJ family response regulator
MSPIVPRLTESTSAAAGSRAGPASDPVNGRPNRSRPSLRLLSGTSGADGPDAVGLEHPAGLNGGAIRVLVAEGRAVVRAGYHALLENAEHIAVVGEAATAHQAIAFAAKTRPDILLLNPALPGLDDREATGRLVSHPALAGAAILVIARSEDREGAVGALRAGAVGVLAADVDPAQLIAEIHAVARGAALISAHDIGCVLHAAPQHGLHTAQVSDQLEELTSREREVLVLVGKGLSNAEIGEALVISPRTAKTHVSRAMLKLGARHRAQLVVLAYESGLVQPRLGPLPRRGSMAATGAGRAGTEAREVGARRAE